MIDALSKYEGRYDFKLILISSMLYNDFFTRTPYEEMVKYKKMIMDKPWIEYYESLPNEEVLEKCRQVDVGLMPSLGDTYGYAVLEMQAAGLPVVTTNIRAFPELNNDECGWICNVPVNDLGMCIERNMPKLYSILEGELERVFDDIFANPEQIKYKGEKAWDRIKRMHDPDEYAKCIEAVMEE
jgi:glycosyltransferase involved in cell wall biosynthesis